ncbi:MAG: carbohydrate-binding family 9-like protein [Candidatus Handelsmanbacteria bacterium]|nr:carbohydrate-binding family 9-like protein [Candidatus Handelsmanbacteria bacterium]
MNPLRGCLLLLLALAWPAGAQDLPLYTCWKAAHPPAIDGKGDEVVWQEASPVELVDVSSLSGDRYHPRRTEVRMLWDAQHFYFYFSAADPDVWSTYNQRDMQLYEEEVVEIFIDPDGDGQNYAEVELNPLNAVLDLLLSKPWSQGGKGYDAWNPALRSAVQVSGTLGNAADVDQGWSAEIALPWADLVSPLADVPGGMRLPPQPGDEWRLNLYRFEQVRQSGARNEVQASAWSPVGRVDFHVPERFGRVVFGSRLTAVYAQSWAQVKAEQKSPGP